MQTIIGSGGAIGVPLAKELNKYTDKIRLVSRHPVKVNATDEPFPLDVTDLSRIDEAIRGSEIVYVTIGFKYSLKVWQSFWPLFMRTVINACKVNHSKLVFFDNVYLYDRSEIPYMTENSVVNPPSKKGAVRKSVHEMIMNEAGKGDLIALIARSADFYGPFLRGSMLGEMVITNLLKNRKPMAFGDIDRIHTYTYTPDAGRAVALLGNTADAFGQVWHMPTTKERLTSRQWIDLIGQAFGRRTGVRVMPEWVIQALGVFSPVMREFPEMLYQYETDYIFDSSKFEKRFGIKATLPRQGLKATIDNLKASRVV